MTRRPGSETRQRRECREFLKDPDTGKRRSVERPRNEWRIESRDDLRIIPPELEEAVGARHRMFTDRAAALRGVWRTNGCPFDDQARARQGLSRKLVLLRRRPHEGPGVEVPRRPHHGAARPTDGDTDRSRPKLL
jgi:hypothetical protein